MLAKIRKDKGISQATLARITGISLRSIQAYESKSRDINKASVQTVYLLSQALDTSIESLLDKERMKNNHALN